MRETTKTITLPVGDESHTFRLTKLDAFTGVKVLRMLSASEAEDLQSLLFSLPDASLDALMRACLAHAEISLPAGYVPVFKGDCWGLPDLEYETALCLRLTGKVADWTLRGFFVEGGQPS